MSEHMEKIGQIIKDLSAEASFSADAMRQFMELKDEVESQERTIDYLRGQNKEKDDKIGKVEARVNDLIEQNNAQFDELQHWRKKSVELAGREVKIQLLEQSVNHERQRVEDHQNMVGLIFRNAEFKKSVLGQELHYQPGNPEMRDQYGNIQTYHEPPGLVPTDVKKDETETQT